MTSPILQSALFALLAAVCFGSALVVTQFGLRHASPLAGGTISVTFTVLLWLPISPALADFSAWHLGGLLVFALVGIFYPCAVMGFTYESNRVLGPTLTGAMSSITPLFATAAAIVGLGERPTISVVVGGFITIVGLVLLALRAPMRTAPGWRLALPLSGAALRGIAQTLTKFGLTMWPNPFAAALVSYATSMAVLWGVGMAIPRPAPRFTRAAVLWFVAVGILNGSAVLLMYHALHLGTVSAVSTIVATYPLFTLTLSAIFLKTERLNKIVVLGAGMIAIGIAIVVKGQ